MQGRVLSRPVELYGETLPKGAKVLLLTGSAGRDDRVWDRPDEFDIKRKPEQHVAFGIGAHFCLGAALARMEGRIALEETLARFPDWRVDTDERGHGCTRAPSAATSRCRSSSERARSRRCPAMKRAPSGLLQYP